MREKDRRFIITFDTTQAAMAAERFFKEGGFPGRLIPVPRQVTAGCGLAWSAPPKDGEALLQGLGRAGIAWQSEGELTI